MARRDDRAKPADSPPRRRWWLVVVVGLASLLVVGALVLTLFSNQLAGALGLPLAPERRFEAAMHEAFVEAGSDGVVVVDEVTGFDWDVVGVFGPYYPHESIVETMGVRVPRGATNNLTYDERCLLVFADGDRLVRWTIISRDIAECVGEASGRVYTPSEAIFAGDYLAPPDVS